MYGILHPPNVYLLVVLFWDDLKKKNQNELDQPTYQLPKLPWIFGVFFNFASN